MTDNPIYRPAAEDFKDMPLPVKNDGNLKTFHSPAVDHLARLFYHERQLRSAKTEGQLYRPACVSDVLENNGVLGEDRLRSTGELMPRLDKWALRILYNAEWRKRGFERSP